jgi:hypothetical protein
MRFMLKLTLNQPPSEEIMARTPAEQQSGQFGIVTLRMFLVR